MRGLSDGKATPNLYEKERIKPNLLARRRAKKNMTLTSGRKPSYAMMASYHRSSNMSFHSNARSAAAKSGSQPPYIQSTESLIEDP